MIGDILTQASSTDDQGAHGDLAVVDRRPPPRLVNDIAVAVAVQGGALGHRIADALSEGGLAPIARASSAEQIVSEPATRLDVVVLAGPVSTSQRAADIRLVRERVPGVEAVVLSSAPGGRGVRKALKAGAAGFVFESELTVALAVTVRAVAAGQVVVPRQLIHHADNPTLSRREKQILGMVVLGFQNQEIAAKLHLAETTVKSHLSSTFKKLDVGSRQEAAALVLDQREGLGPGILSMPGAEQPPGVKRGT